MSKPASTKVERIGLALIDEPERPIRQTIAPEHIEALAYSLKAVGQLQPVVLERSGSRYRIRAGHCRYLAARMAGIPDLLAMILPPGQASTAAVTYHENRFREEVNPAEEAEYLASLLGDGCGGDTDVLARLVCERREYVEERLLLYAGDAEVFAALKRREISIAAAKELNKYHDAGLRRSRLVAAISGGATARVVREWRLKDEQLEEFMRVSAAAPASEGPQAAPTMADPLTCFCCESAEDKHEMEIIYVHRGCKRWLRHAATLGSLGRGEGRGSDAAA